MHFSNRAGLCCLIIFRLEILSKNTQKLFGFVFFVFLTQPWSVWQRCRRPRHQHGSWFLSCQQKTTKQNVAAKERLSWQASLAAEMWTHCSITADLYVTLLRVTNQATALRMPSAVSALMQVLGFIWCIKHRLKKAEMCSTGSCFVVFIFFCLQIKLRPGHMIGQTAVYSAVCFVYSSTMPWHKPCVNRWRLSACRFIAANWSHHCAHAGHVGSRACALVTNSLTAVD